MRHRISSLAVIGLVGFGLTGCTSQEIAATGAGIQAVCAGAIVGTTVYVNVESSLGGATAQKISQVVSSSTSTACSSLSAAVQAAVNSITAEGGTATVSVSTATPTTTAAKSLKRKLVAKALVFKDAAGQVQVTYVVKPDIVIPFIGAL